MQLRYVNWIFIIFHLHFSLKAESMSFSNFILHLKKKVSKKKVYEKKIQSVIEKLLV